MDKIINMDAVFHKLKSTVSTTVSQLSSVLPGNPVTREYEVTSYVGCAGPGYLWRIYSGTKKSTKEPASVFVLEKKLLDTYNKKDRDIYLDILKKGIHQLTKLKHPQILTVDHPLEESRESLAFATEPVLSSLGNIIAKVENMASPLPGHLKDFTLYEVEIKYGLVQLSEGIEFLHSGVKMLHRNLSPESIIVNQNGAWKLFGFDFCLQCVVDSKGSTVWPFQEFNTSLHPDFQPNLNYLAPEYALTLHTDPSSDMFSLGSLAYSIFSGGSPLLNCYGDFPTFKRNCCELMNLTSQNMACVPAPLREHIKLLLNKTPEIRPDAQQFSKADWFDDVLVKTLSYMDAMFQWDNLQKSQFYKGLPQILPQVPHRVALHRVVPSLVKEFINSAMIPFVLPAIFFVANNSSNNEFVQFVLPHLKRAMKLTEPVQISLIILQKMELLLSKTPAEDIKSDVFPMLYTCLETDAQQIQELALTVIPNCGNLIDYNSMKNSLLPRIKKLCLGTSYLSTRVNCLVCIGKLLDHLDKWLVLDEVLPLLPQIPSKEPAVIMGMLGIIKITMDHKKLGLTKETMATKVLPFLLPLCVENGLAVPQFRALMAVVRDLVDRVESEHLAKLEQLNTAPQGQRKVTTPVSNGTSASMDVFQSLGLGSFFKKNTPVVASSGAAAIVDPPEHPPTISTASTLSLDEKRRIAREQEMRRTMKSTAPLSPTKLTHVVTSSAPRPTDLTSQLINSNIAKMEKPLPQGHSGTLVARPPAMMWSQPNMSGSGARALSPTSYRPIAPLPASQRPLIPSIQSTNFQPFCDPMSLRPQASPSTNVNEQVRPLSASDIKDLLS